MVRNVASPLFFTAILHKIRQQGVEIHKVERCSE